MKMDEDNMTKFLLFSLSTVSSLLFLQISNRALELIHKDRQYRWLFFVILCVGLLDLLISFDALRIFVHG